MKNLFHGYGLKLVKVLFSPRCYGELSVAFGFEAWKVFLLVQIEYAKTWTHAKYKYPSAVEKLFGATLEIKNIHHSPTLIYLMVGRLDEQKGVGLKSR